MLAFEQAVAQGADALELDVRCSRDGVVVVIHDDTLDRTTDKSGPVAARSARELTCTDAGSGQSIPTLDQVLEHFAATPLIVEVKETVAAEATARCLARHQAEARVVVGSFESRALHPFRASPFHRASSKLETAAAFLTSRVGLRAPGRYKAFTVPEQRGRLHLVDSRFVSAAVRAGRPVHVWTVDDVHQARRLWSIGVSGIITNVPARIGAMPERATP